MLNSTHWLCFIHALHRKQWCFIFQQLFLCDRAWYSFLTCTRHATFLRSAGNDAGKIDVYSVNALDTETWRHGANVDAVADIWSNKNTQLSRAIQCCILGDPRSARHTKSYFVCWYLHSMRPATYFSRRHFECDEGILEPIPFRVCVCECMNLWWLRTLANANTMR